jgi:hypothetical protein
MARGFPWFRFWVDAHGKGKILALSDPEFRLWTRILALARESETPGLVYVTPGVGWAPKDLARSAGCRTGKPDAMIKRLAQLRCIALLDGGVIEVHDWEEHNPPASPSKMPEARRQQKRDERGRHRRKDVASVSPTDNLPTGQNVGKADVEREKEKEGEEEKQQQPVRDARVAVEAAHSAPPAAAPVAGFAEAMRRLPEPDEPVRRLEIVDESGPHASAPPFPLAGAFRQRLSDALARTALHPVGGGRDVLEQVEASLGAIPLERAVDLCRERDLDDVKHGRKRLQTLAGFLQVLADEVVRIRAQPKRGGLREYLGHDADGKAIYREEAR